MEHSQASSDSSASLFRTYSNGSSPKKNAGSGDDEDGDDEPFGSLPEIEIEEMVFPEDPFGAELSDEEYPLSASTGPKPIHHWGDLSLYRAIAVDSPAVALFNNAVDEIFAWLSESEVLAFCFTLVRSGDKPVVIVFTESLESLPPNCPVDLPVELVRRSLLGFTPGSTQYSYDWNPWNPWYDEVVRPGSSIGCISSGSFGGYLRSQDGRIFGLTAGHVARRFLTDVKVSREEVELTSPSKGDAIWGKACAMKGMVDAQFGLEVATMNGKSAIKAAKKEPESVELQNTAKKWKYKADVSRRAFNAFSAYKESSKTNGAQKFAKVVMSVVAVTKHIDDSITKPGWQRNEDWALLQPEAARTGQNVITLSDRSLRLEAFASMTPGMLVVKKGRSTGITFGRVNGVQLHIKLETSRAPTAEWMVLPLKADEAGEPACTSLFHGSNMKDELNRRIIPDHFAYVGDSGSFVLEAETGQVVGMVMGGILDHELRVCVVTPFETIVNCMNERLRRYGIQFEADCLALRAPTAVAERQESQEG
ncbi:hypothetical protein DRE_02772 [Drechslerella stenobrocha 248]|uniref:Uncharacterized protein n=1 Tax=Drechslerella stenobrocha 248 TaxID=1043628 RepID=W7IFG5_9PEZI|nr:hypothetical protein DRE_02772 [Drechslerella stenobrocha 248]